MFLSRITLDLRNRKVQRTLQDPYRLHQAILQAYPPDAPGGGGRTLFRVEPEQEDVHARILVQSELEPDWSRAELAERLPMVRFDPPRELTLGLTPGQEVRFRLRANPTKRSNERRIAVIGEEAQLEWLRRKLEKGGLEVLGVRRRDEGMRSGTRREGEAARRLTFVSVLFEGVARVAAPEAVTEAVAGGVGSGKAFGFGLLSLARR